MNIGEDHPIWQAIDDGGGQTCDVAGVLRELYRAGYTIVEREILQPVLAGSDTVWIRRYLIQYDACDAIKINKALVPSTAEIISEKQASELNAAFDSAWPNAVKHG